jgi:predicted metal-dependent hydrolase
MIDWLKRTPREEPVVQIGDTALPLAIRRLPHARRLTLRLAPDGSEARVSMPRWGRTQDAVEFARSRADWLAHQLAALPKPAEPGDGSTIPFRGDTLRIVHRPAARRRPVREGDLLVIGGPADSIAPRIRRWMEGEVRALLGEDLADYCARASKAAPKLGLSNAQRRWGSCGPDGTIRINWRLAMAPDFVRRSVVAHEVAHLVHFDHSPRFHAFLGGLFEGDIAAANAWLKRHGRGLYAPLG